MKILIIGMGHVGKGVMKALKDTHEVSTLDLDRRKSRPYLGPRASIEPNELFFICLPTDLSMGVLDCSQIENYLVKINEYKKHATVIIKSTLNLGFMERARSTFKNLMLYYLPEFSEEANIGKDMLNPDRVIVGYDKKVSSEAFIKRFLKEGFKRPLDHLILFMGYGEAELVKLASNAYLAARVAFMNEIDSICLTNDLNSHQVIKGICLDERIGNLYNNPSLGFGGYCLPKDTYALTHLVDDRYPLLDAISRSNFTRLEVLLGYVKEHYPTNTTKTIGIYKVGFKEKSRNVRESASLHLARMLKDDYKVVLFDPPKEASKLGFMGSYDLAEFFSRTDLIVANRYERVLAPVTHKLLCPDLRTKE